jgi:DNA-binding beta-propeller fold protein YncE
VTTGGDGVSEIFGRVAQYSLGAGGALTAKSPALVPVGANASQAVVVSPDGQSVYVTNSGAPSDTVAQFDVGADGALTAKSTPTVSAGGGGSFPTRIAMSPDGRNLYVTNRDFPVGSVFQFDVGAGGALTAKSPAEVVSVGAPLTDIAVRPTYDFTGFFRPVNNPADPEPNSVKAGQSVPVKFSLGGDQGLDVLDDEAPNPKLLFSQCDPSDEADPVGTSTANNGLTYDALTDTYTYVWKTVKGWKGKCGTFTLKLDDGTVHTAEFAFK